MFKKRTKNKSKLSSSLSSLSASAATATESSSSTNDYNYNNNTLFKSSSVPEYLITEIINRINESFGNFVPIFFVCCIISFLCTGHFMDNIFRLAMFFYPSYRTYLRLKNEYLSNGELYNLVK